MSNTSFDFPRFWNWVQRQEGIYISDTVPKDGMIVIWDKLHYSKASAAGNAKRRELLMMPCISEKHSTDKDGI